MEARISAALQKKQEREGRPVIYLDETWANARDGIEKMWVEDDPRAVGGTKGGIRKPSGKGSRLIILHAGIVITDELTVRILCFKVRRRRATIMTR